MRYLLDTCAISELVRPRPDRSVVEWLEEQDEHALYLSVLTIGELQKGINKLPMGRKRQILQKWLDHDLASRFHGRLISVDFHIATRWGALSGDAERAGLRLPAIDALLAASALESGATLVTRNTVHFAQTGVALHNPWSNPRIPRNT